MNVMFALSRSENKILLLVIATTLCDYFTEYIIIKIIDNIIFWCNIHTLVSDNLSSNMYAPFI